VCPGRGSYDRASLGSLRDRSPPAAAIVARCDAWRESRGRPTMSAIDSEPSFRTSLHAAGEHASLLTFACSMADAASLDPDRYEVVGVIGNSMGWYTALAASGALEIDDAIRLVDTFGWYQHGNVIGGQILYPVTDEEWQPAAALEEAVAKALESTPGAEWSIRLGGFAVLGAGDEGVRALLTALPPIKRGDRTFPVQLPLHSAFHTSHLAATRDRARHDLADLAFRSPDVPLTDGRGATFRPRWTDPTALAAYTLGHQVVKPYDFTTSLRAALRHCAPDVVVALGPGNSLGGPIARTLVAEGWRGIRTKAEFEAQQRRSALLLSFGVSVQRKLLA
jgi:acyl transferase domain-containing protein